MKGIIKTLNLVYRVCLKIILTTWMLIGVSNVIDVEREHPDMSMYQILRETILRAFGKIREYYHP